MNTSQSLKKAPEFFDFIEPENLKKRIDLYYDVLSNNPIVGGHILKGKTPQEDSLMFVSNDYLSLSQNNEIMAAQKNNLSANGHGLLRSGVFSSEQSPSRGFELAVAEWANNEDALLTQSGMAANIGLIQSIADENTPIYIDMFAHMSLWEGIKSANAKAIPFRHNNVDSLSSLIKKNGPGIIVVDSIYSTSGDVCPLYEIVDICQKNNCMIIVDESHSLGVVGKQGRGMVYDLNLTQHVHFVTASLSKAFSARGGIIIGSSRHIEYLKYTSLHAIFSSAVLPHEISGLSKTLDIIKRDEFRRHKLKNNAKYLRSAIGKIGYNIGDNETQIIPLVAGPEHMTMILRDQLETYDIFGSPFCDPATPKNRSLIRLTINAEHTFEQLDYVAMVLDNIKDQVKLHEWPQQTKRKLRLV